MEPTGLLEAIERFASRDPGLQSFQALAEDCRRLASTARSGQAALALVGVAADQVADRFEGQALSIEDALAARRRLAEAGTAVAHTLDGPADARVAACDRFAAEVLLEPR